MSLPIPNIDDLEYSHIREELIQDISRSKTPWTDYNIHDPGITLLEMFAWQTELMLYRFNRITDRHRLKFLKLLGTAPVPISPAWVLLSVHLDNTTNPGWPVYFPEGSEVEALLDANRKLTFTTTEPIWLVPHEIEKVMVKHHSDLLDFTQANATPGMFFNPFGPMADSSYELLIGLSGKWKASVNGIPFRIWFKPSGGKTGVTENTATGSPDSFILPDAVFNQVKLSAEIVWKYNTGVNTPDWKEFQPHLAGQFYDENNPESSEGFVFDRTLALGVEGPLYFHLGKDARPCRMTEGTTSTKKLYWIKCCIKSGRYEDPPRADTFTANVVPGSNIQKYEKRTLHRVKGSTIFYTDRSSGLPGQQFDVGQKPVISLQLYVNEGQAGEIPDWIEVQDFDASGADDNHYILDRDSGLVTFGDGIRGRIPPKESIIISRVCTWGGGTVGNIKANMNWNVVTLPSSSAPEDIIVQNPFPARGGSDRETIDDAFSRILKDLESRYRAITLDDYEQLAFQTPGVRLARAKAWSFPDATGVEIVVVPESVLERPEPEPAFLENIYCHLKNLRLITTRIKVSKPDYVPVKVIVYTRALEGFKPQNLTGPLSEAIIHFLDPLKGGLDGKGWPFGGGVYLSHLYEICSNVKGIDCIENIWITSSHQGISFKEGNLIIEDHQLVYPLQPEIVVNNSFGTCTIAGGKRAKNIEKYPDKRRMLKGRTGGID